MLARLDGFLQGWRLFGAAIVIFTVLSVAITHPQIRYMSDGVPDVGDPLLNVWALAWIAHQLPFSPSHVFDGNIFHPEPHTLAYSETLLAPGLLGAPLLWLGAGPILVYNLLLLASFVFSGVGVAAVVYQLTGRRSAGVVAGAIFAFLPFRFDHYSHFQLLQTQFMPLALWGLHRVLSPTVRWRDGVVLGLGVGLQVLTSVYNAVFLGLFMAVVGGVWLLRVGLTPSRVKALAAAAVVTGVLSYPVGVAHLKAREVVGERSRGEAESGSAQWGDFLATVRHSTLHGEWSRHFGAPERRLFPGAMAIVLGLLAMWPPLSPVRIAYALGTLFALEMSRGFNGWLYTFLYDYLFVLSSLRVPARMGLMLGLGLAVLSGFGVATLRSRLGRRGATVLATALLAAVLADTWVGPLRFAEVAEEPPLIYDDLLRDKREPLRSTIIRRRSDKPAAVLLELPFGAAPPTYMYYSTFHWQTLVNGYSGFFSPRYYRLNDRLAHFPSADTDAALNAINVRYITVHGEYMSPRDYQQLTSRLDRMAPAYRLVNRRPWAGSEISLYRYTPSPAS